MSCSYDRELAYLALRDIESGSSWSNLALKQRLGGGKPGPEKKEAGSPAFVRELVYGVLRNQILLDANIDRFVKKIKTPERIILRIGLYQLCRMDSVTQYAAVNESVELAKRYAKGREKLVNGVLRNFIRQGCRLSAEDDCTLYSVQPWIWDVLCESYGVEKTKAMLGSCLGPAKLSLRRNPLRCSEEEFEKLLSGGEAASLISSEAYKNGLFSVQGQASQRAVRALAPQPGDFVIDMCAAPGGKSCAAAEMMQNSGRVLAFDLYPHRVELIRKEAKRLGLGIIEAREADASKPFSPQLAESADCVICDVPCSGLGVIKKKPEIKLRASKEEAESLPALQLAILENAASCLKPDGRLLYSTCTVIPAENSAVKDKFIKGHPEFELLEESLTLPDETNDDGFYFCVLRKRNGKCRF